MAHNTRVTAPDPFDTYLARLDNYLSTNEKLYNQDMTTIFPDFTSYQVKSYRKRAAEEGHIVQKQEGYQGPWYIRKPTGEDLEQGFVGHARRSLSAEMPPKVLDYVKAHGSITLNLFKSSFHVTNTAVARSLLHRMVTDGQLKESRQGRTKFYTLGSGLRQTKAQKAQTKVLNTAATVAGTLDPEVVITGLLNRYEQILGTVEDLKAELATVTTRAETAEDQLKDLMGLARQYNQREELTKKEDTQVSPESRALPTNLRNRLESLINRDQEVTGASSLGNHLKQLQGQANKG